MDDFYNVKAEAYDEVRAMQNCLIADASSIESISDGVSMLHPDLASRLDKIACSIRETVAAIRDKEGAVSQAEYQYSVGQMGSILSDIVERGK